MLTTLELLIADSEEKKPSALVCYLGLWLIVALVLIHSGLLAGRYLWFVAGLLLGRLVLAWQLVWIGLASLSFALLPRRVVFAV